SESPPATLLGWLASGRLRGRLRYARPGGPTLLIDADAPAYHGPSALKPLAQYFEGEVAQGDLEPVDEAAWKQAVSDAGAPQPLARLVWLGALVSGKGQLLPGHDPEARYQLTRWPQTEREFPRHFRIATAVMNGPATLAEIAAGTGVAIGEIADFVNANLATGIAGAVPEQPAEPAAPARGGGLLGRLRGRCTDPPCTPHAPRRIYKARHDRLHALSAPPAHRRSRRPAPVPRGRAAGHPRPAAPPPA